MPEPPRKLRDLNPVAWENREDGAVGFTFDCPCGGDHSAAVRTSGPGAWITVSGEFPDSLTLQPSIKVHSGHSGGECWHGHLIDGEMRPC